MFSSERPNHFRRASRFVGMVILGVFTAVILALLFGYFIQLLWNWLMPTIFKLSKINYWQAFGLVLLARLIFGTIGHHSGHKYHRHHRHCHPRPEWEHDGEHVSQWQIKGGWKNWKHYDTWWHDEGKQAFEQYLEKSEHKE